MDRIPLLLAAAILSVSGAWGIVLAAPNDSTEHYSYWDAAARLRITYTIYDD